MRKCNQGSLLSTRFYESLNVSSQFNRTASALPKLFLPAYYATSCRLKRYINEVIDGFAVFNTLC